METPEFKIGDHVEFLNEVGGGQVVEVFGDEVHVLGDDDFVFIYQANQLVLKKDWQPIEPKEESVSESNSERTERLDGFRLIGDKKKYMEVDLHMHMVSSETRDFTNHEMVLTQLSHFEKTLAEARKLRLGKVVYIHGIGKGRLRNEIRKRLRDRKNCEFEDGDYTKYGYGATEVKLWYN